MAAKPGPKKKSGSTRRSAGAEEKDQLISELKNRVAALEKEFRLKQGNDTSDDNTERKQAEEALCESESRFRQLSESLPQLVWTCRADGPCDYLSPQWVSYTGVPEDEQLGYGWLDQVHPDDRERVSREWALAAAHGEVFDIEFRIRRFDGAYRWFKTRAIPLKDNAGALVKWFGSNTDIDDIKRAEDALRESEARLAVDLAAMASLQKISTRFVRHGDLSSLFADIMEAAVDIAGADKGTLQLIRSGTERLDIVAQRGFESYYIDFFSSVSHSTAAVCATAFQRGERVVVEDVDKSPIFVGTPALDVQRKAGVRAVQSTPIVNRRGEMIGMLSTHWGKPHRRDERVLRYIDLLARQAADIIERKRAEETLRDSEERYKLVVAGAQGAIWDWDVPNKRVFFSPQWKTLRGLADGEVRDSEEEWSSGIHPEDLPGVMAAVRAHFEGRTPVFSEEYRVRCKDGSWKWISDRGLAQRDSDGRVVRMAGSETDITERKRTEEALRESEARFRSYFEIPLIGIAITSPEKGVISVNDKFCTIVGYSEDELKSLTWDKITYPEDLAKDIEQFNHVLAGEIDSYTLEKRFVKKNGAVVPTILSVGCVRHPDRTINYFIATIQDITERKRAEESLKEAKLQAELYLDLMGHDISNMHQIILGQLQLAEDIMNEDGKLEAADRELIDTSIKNLLRSAKLIDNVKNLQRLQAGDYSRVPIDLGMILDDAVATYSGLPEKKVNIDYRPVTGYVARVNPLIKEVIYNLLDNAVKHSGDETKIGIRVGRAERNGRQYHRVTIEDNGPGIPDEKKVEVFHRLKRGQTKARGTGLGLYLVKTLVESFGGFVELEDRVRGDYSQGCRFNVYLPAVEGDNNGK